MVGTNNRGLSLYMKYDNIRKLEEKDMDLFRESTKKTNLFKNNKVSQEVVQHIKENNYSNYATDDDVLIVPIDIVRDNYNKKE